RLGCPEMADGRAQPSTAMRRLLRGGAIGSQQASQARGVLLDQVEAPEYQLEDAEQHRHNHGDAELPDPRRETDRDRGEDVYCVARLLEIVAEADRRYDTGQAERV